MTTKLVYQLDEHDVLVGATEALESPLEPGVFLIPAGCIDTDIIPPTVDDPSSYVFWREGNWWIGHYIDPNAPKPEDLARIWRDAELARSDIMLYKIQDGMPNLGSVGDWRKYRIALRTWPEVEGFPSVHTRPVAPDFKEE